MNGSTEGHSGPAPLMCKYTNGRPAVKKIMWRSSQVVKTRDLGPPIETCIPPHRCEALYFDRFI